MTGDRFAIGATVTVWKGDQKFVRPVLRSYSYLASNDPRVHFGLGNLDAIEGIEVRWANGSKERFAGGVVDREITVRQGEGQAIE